MPKGSFAIFFNLKKLIIPFYTNLPSLRYMPLFSPLTIGLVMLGLSVILEKSKYIHERYQEISRITYSRWNGLVGNVSLTDKCPREHRMRQIIKL